MTFTFVPILPLWAIALIGAGLLVLLGYGSMVLRKDKGIADRWVMYLGAMRIIAVALFVLLLLRPIIGYTRNTVDKPNLLVMLDSSASMGQDASGAPDPRLRQTIEAMESRGLRASIESSFDVPWFSFDSDVRPVAIGDLHRIDAVGTSKDLASSIETAWQYHRLQLAGTAAGSSANNRLLVVTDGNHLGDEDPVEVARRLGLTLYTLPARDVDQPAQRPTISVAGFQGPASVLLGSEARFRVRVRVEGNVTAGPVQLELQSDGKTVATRQLAIDPKHAEQSVDLTYVPTKAGRTPFELHVRPADGGPTFEPDRPATLSVNVRGRSDNVLVLEDSWRWDFRFLRRLFEDDPNFTFTAFLSRQPGIYMQFAEPETTVRLNGFPRTRDELDAFDTFILGDVNPAHWAPELAPALHDLVVERGKSLIVIAGPGMTRLAQVPELRSLLPVEPRDNAAGFTPGPVPVAPAAGAKSSAIFYSPEGTDFFGAFGELPPMDQIYAPLRKRPAANLLMEAPGIRNDYGNLIVMAEQTVGRGRVLYVGTDSLWKWHTLGPRDAQERTAHQVFWQQALRAMSPQRVSSGPANLWLQTDRTQYQVAQPVHFTTELEAPQQATVKVTITLPDGRSLPAAIRPHPTEARKGIADFEPPVPGTYTLTGRAELDGKTIAESVTQIQVEPRPSLLAKRANDMATLQRLASETGGNVISLDDPKTWPQPAATEQQVAQAAHRFDLWQNGVLLVLLVLVLGADWLVRLLRGFF